MAKKKIVETLLSAALALIGSVKSFVKFVGYIIRMGPETAKT